jgi:plastocyanin
MTMRTLTVSFLTAIGLVLAVPAATATLGVSITKTGFSPKTVTVVQGDTVTWTNADSSNHQVVSDRGLGGSPVLKPGEGFSATFPAAGDFPYHDGLNPKEKGTVKVKAAPTPPASLSLASSAARVVYGRAVTLGGTISTRKDGEQVAVLARAYGESNFAPLATVTTGSGGAWTYAAKPGIQTSYQARWKNASSSEATIGVQPLVTLHVLTGRRFSTRSVAARSFAGKLVKFQRQNRFGEWVTLKQVRLGSNSGAVFRFTLPHGTSPIRVVLSVNQAGPGYLAGVSRTVSYRRA